MNLADLQLLIDISRAGSFAAAARQRDLDPSVISRRVLAVERKLGLRLFQRSTRRMQLTEAGETYLRSVEGALDELEHAREAAQGLGAEPAGHLRLTASVTFGYRLLVPQIAELRRRYPRMRIELILTDSNLDLVSERIDLAIRLAPHLDVDMVGFKLFDTHYRVCASPAYLASKPAPLDRPANLEHHRCLRLTLPGHRSRWVARDAEGRRSEVHVDGDVLISNVMALVACARDGLGPALLPHWLIEPELARGELVDLFPEHHVTATDFQTAAWLLYPSRAFLPLKTRATVDFLRETLGSIR